MRIFTMDATLPANELQQQLERTADTVVRRLEDKIAHLEYLLDEADARIELLEKHIEASLVKAKALPDKIVPPAPVQVMNAYKMPDLAEKQETAPVSAPKEEVDPKAALPNDRKRVVLSMAEQGYNVTEIAKVLGMGKGEVMLLLQLNKASK